MIKKKKKGSVLFLLLLSLGLQQIPKKKGKNSNVLLWKHFGSKPQTWKPVNILQFFLKSFLPPKSLCLWIAFVWPLVLHGARKGDETLKRNKKHIYIHIYSIRCIEASSVARSLFTHDKASPSALRENSTKQ